MNKQRRNAFAAILVPVILAENGAVGNVNTATLPKADWKIHSGFAPVANENVHSLQSQKIAGTKNIVIQAETGRQLCVTDGEAEKFSYDHLIGLGYTVQAPQGGARRQ